MQSEAEDQVTISEPGSQAELDAYYRLRWEVLRKPHGQPPGSERSPLDMDSVHLVARIDGRVVGAAAFHLRTTRTRELGKGIRIPRRRPRSLSLVRQMAVAEGYRGRGIGDALMAEIESRCERAGVREYVVHARTSAVAFYARHCYRATGPGATLFGEVEHCVMSKRPARAERQNRRRRRVCGAG